MKKNFHKISHNLKHVAAIVFFGVLLLVGFSGVRADQGDQYKASGYAYGSISDDGDNQADTGIGYLNFGCESGLDSACDQTATENFPSGYGVRINTNPQSEDNGKIFGYAWSSNYGWVSFYHNDVAGCGAEGGLEINGDVQTAINTPGWGQTLDGYARVLNYDENKWNGCIKFSGYAENGSFYQTKIGRIDSGELELKGWAWGGDVVGWVSFSCEHCKVIFKPVEAECEEADDPTECAPEGPGAALSLYVGNPNSPVTQVIGNSTYALLITDNVPQTVQLVPQVFGADVDTCSASYSSSQNATVAGWSGTLPTLDPLIPNELSNQFFPVISNYQIGEIITLTINCLTVEGDIPVSADAFVNVQYPVPFVSIDADPNPINTTIDPGGNTQLSWDFSNVQNGSCEINGFVDLTPADGSDGLQPLIVGSMGFNSPSPDDPGSDGLTGIVNFPVAFQITCDDYMDQPVSDSVYITTTDIGCTDSMEAAGWCSNDINPIFEEF